MNRKEEIRELLALTPEDVVERSGARLSVCDDLDELHRAFASDVHTEIADAARAGTPCRLILPVGPTGGYPYLATLIRDSGTTLSHCRFFFMDEYSLDDGRELPESHPLSFKGVMKPLFFDRLSAKSGLGPHQVVFPGQENIEGLAGLIDETGGIDACFGGIGIHGHVAFNEPQPGIADSDPRRVILNDFTVTINAVRSHVGGDLENFPRTAYTLGMKQILGAKRIRLYCRNGTDFDWANTVLRLSLFGTPGDDYPVTHIREKDYRITTDRDTLASPEVRL